MLLKINEVFPVSIPTSFSQNLEYNMSSLQTILEAVSTLSNINEVDREGLLLHREELKVALDSLHTLLQTPCASVSGSNSTLRSPTRLQATPGERNTPTTPPPATPPPATSSPAISSPATPHPAISSPATSSPATPPPATSSPATLRPATPVRADDLANTETPKCIVELINLLDKRETEILQYMQQDPESVIQSRTDWSTEDPRIVDISQIDSPDKTSPDLNIRCGFGALSLADEYTEWEYQTKLNSKRNQCRIDQLCGNLNSGNRGSFYKEFVDSRQFKDHDKARKYRCDSIFLFSGLYAHKVP
ncbi:hypothetical protein BDV23DRAFT_162185 [Aspergillus alliaceus]|uniref:Uncharacterized protein n=1 Tax=Petromyces alliaceus TaxID=209559 RepID=A0A5N7BZB3_PETAA|nr:hypothetical protein BDV23DRAFT_162185 [Aspergillus alliaceus]